MFLAIDLKEWDEILNALEAVGNENLASRVRGQLKKYESRRVVSKVRSEKAHYREEKTYTTKGRLIK